MVSLTSDVCYIDLIKMLKRTLSMSKSNFRAETCSHLSFTTTDIDLHGCLRSVLSTKVNLGKWFGDWLGSGIRTIFVRICASLCWNLIYQIADKFKYHSISMEYFPEILWAALLNTVFIVSWIFIWLAVTCSLLLWIIFSYNRPIHRMRLSRDWLDVKF